MNNIKNLTSYKSERVPVDDVLIVKHRIVNDQHYFDLNIFPNEVKEWCEEQNCMPTTQYGPARMKNGKITLWQVTPGFRIIIKDKSLAMLFKLTFYKTNDV